MLGLRVSTNAEVFSLTQMRLHREKNETEGNLSHTHTEVVRGVGAELLPNEWLPYSINIVPSPITRDT